MTRLDPRDVEVIAERVAELVLAELEPRRPRSLMDANEVAAFLSVDPEWVRDHASVLGGVRLGNGAKPRLRFRLEAIENYLLTRAAQPENPEPKLGVSRRRRRKASGDLGSLLPIRGGSEG